MKSFKKDNLILPLTLLFLFASFLFFISSLSDYQLEKQLHSNLQLAKANLLDKGEEKAGIHLEVEKIKKYPINMLRYLNSENTIELSVSGDISELMDFFKKELSGRKLYLYNYSLEKAKDGSYVLTIKGTL